MEQHSHFEETGKQMSFEEIEVVLKREFGPHLNEIEKIFSGQVSDEEKAMALKRVFEQIPDENFGSCLKCLKPFFEQILNECEVAQFPNQMSEEQIGKRVKNYFEHLSKENMAVLIKFSLKNDSN